MATWPADRSGRSTGRELLQQRRGRLFRKYVILTGTLVSGALLASGLLELYFSYQEHKAALVRVQREKAQAAAGRIESFIKELERQIGWVTHLRLGSGATALRQRRFEYLRLLRQVPAITEISQLDRAGKEQLRVSRLAMDVIGSQADFSRDPRYLETRGGKTYFSPVYFRKESEPYITIAVAGSGEEAGVTVTEVNLKFIWDVISQIKIGQGGYAYVLDSRGHLIAHPDINLALQKMDLASLSQVQAARTAPLSAGMERNDITVARDLQGRQVLTAYSPIAPLGWLVFVDLPLKEAFAPLYSSLLRTAVLLLAALALSMVASLVLARKMVTPIQALQTGAVRIGAGALDYRIKVETGDELEALADQLNSMAAQLEESYANLEQKVETRTRELQARTRELARSVDELNALGAVGQTVSSTLDLPTVLTTIVTHAVQLSGSDGGAIYEYSEGTQGFLLRATYQMEEELIQTLREKPVRLGEGAVGRAGAFREPVQIPDIFEDPAYTGRLREMTIPLGFRAIVAIPLLREDRIVGGLAVWRKSPGAFPQELVDLLQTFATQSVLAIQNARLFREIEEKGQQLAVADRYKSEFLTNVSHELRTPLTAIKGSVDNMLDGLTGELNGKQVRYLTRVKSNTDRLARLINDLLDLSKIEAGRIDLKPMRLDMVSLVHELAETLRPVAMEKRISLEVVTLEPGAAAWADRDRVVQVVTNLLGNALKFTPEAGKVTVALERNGPEWIRVSVADTGPGIPPEETERIFDKFYQLSAGAGQRGSGTGLGLAISKALVEMQGGRISVESQVGGGSTFTFTLPARASADPSPAAEEVRSA